MIRISILRSASKRECEDLATLAADLHESKRLPVAKAASDVKRLLKNPDAVLFVAKDGAKIVGMTMLFVMQKVGKRGGSVEDVVVSSAYRGHGIGEKLMRALLKEARKRGLSSLGLTSRPSRVAANRLYRKLGFKMRDTNVYIVRF